MLKRQDDAAEREPSPMTRARRPRGRTAQSQGPWAVFWSLLSAARRRVMIWAAMVAIGSLVLAVSLGGAGCLEAPAPLGTGGGTGGAHSTTSATTSIATGMGG